MKARDLFASLVEGAPASEREAVSKVAPRGLNAFGALLAEAVDHDVEARSSASEHGSEARGVASRRAAAHGSAHEPRDGSEPLEGAPLAPVADKKLTAGAASSTIGAVANKGETTIEIPRPALAIHDSITRAAPGARAGRELAKLPVSDAGSALATQPLEATFDPRAEEPSLVTSELEELDREPEPALLAAALGNIAAVLAKIVAPRPDEASAKADGPIAVGGATSSSSHEVALSEALQAAGEGLGRAAVPATRDSGVTRSAAVVQPFVLDGDGDPTAARARAAGAPARDANAAPFTGAAPSAPRDRAESAQDVRVFTSARLEASGLGASEHDASQLGAAVSTPMRDDAQRFVASPAAGAVQPLDRRAGKAIEAGVSQGSGARAVVAAPVRGEPAMSPPTATPAPNGAELLATVPSAAPGLGTQTAADPTGGTISTRTAQVPVPRDAGAAQVGGLPSAAKPLQANAQLVPAQGRAAEPAPPPVAERRAPVQAGPAAATSWAAERPATAPTTVTFRSSDASQTSTRAELAKPVGATASQAARSAAAPGRANATLGLAADGRAPNRQQSGAALAATAPIAQSALPGGRATPQLETPVDRERPLQTPELADATVRSADLPVSESAATPAAAHVTHSDASGGSARVDSPLTTPSTPATAPTQSAPLLTQSAPRADGALVPPADARSARAAQSGRADESMTRVHGFARGALVGQAISAYGGRGHQGGEHDDRAASSQSDEDEAAATVYERAPVEGPARSFDPVQALQAPQQPAEAPATPATLAAPQVPVAAPTELPDYEFAARPANQPEAASISLHHPDLGPIQLEVHRDRGRVEVHAVIESAHAEAVLRANESGIRQGVQQSGLNFSALRVRVRGEDNQPNRPAPVRRRRMNNQKEA
jgi:hypothetical protein